MEYTNNSGFMCLNDYSTFKYICNYGTSDSVIYGNLRAIDIEHIVEHELSLLSRDERQ